MLGFQSLIGRLKTWNRREPPETGGKFQSLIGRLKTQFLKALREFSNVFQSLIGRLKTLSESPSS